MAQFEPAIALVLKHEGGYTPGLPGDPGGETNFGISRAAHPDLDIANLTQAQAEQIYETQYWEPEFEALQDQRLANAAFDFAVNAGLGRSLGLLAANATVEAFTLERIRYYASLSNFNRFAASWVRRSLEY